MGKGTIPVRRSSETYLYIIVKKNLFKFPCFTDLVYYKDGKSIRSYTATQGVTYMTKREMVVTSSQCKRNIGTVLKNTRHKKRQQVYYP